MPFPVILVAATATGTSTVALEIFWSIVGIGTLGYLLYPPEQELPLPSSPLTGIIQETKQQASKSEAIANAVLPVQPAQQLSLSTSSIKQCVKSAQDNIAETVESIDNLPAIHTAMIESLGELSQSQRQIHGFFQKIHEDFAQIKPPSQAEDEMMDLRNHIVFLKKTIKTKDAQIDEYQKQIKVMLTMLSANTQTLQPEGTKICTYRLSRQNPL